ncbi:family protein [Stylonychia lemnae]|uniref:Family protein n=1 Tax=Stylonychia lemnae TaxID=5949 RepID=A0A078AVS7_STYLE|nr:family protein [Stylonychia lemnae]|eukprot:CDW84878.1 family protein [Stylonychia lemnae]
MSDSYKKLTSHSKITSKSSNQQYKEGLLSQTQDDSQADFNYKNDQTKVYDNSEDRQKIYKKLNDAPDEMSLSRTIQFFARHSYRDIKRKKCHFCLAFCSVFIVVMFSLVVNTLVQRGPIIFLKVVEGTEGEIDGVISGSNGEHSKQAFSTMSDDNMLNYTRVMEALATDDYRLSPRKTFCGSKIGSDQNNKNIIDHEDESEMAKWRAQYDPSTNMPSRDQAYSPNVQTLQPACLMLWDTKLEQKNEIGRLYEFEPMKYGECSMTQKQAENLNVQEGDMIYYQMYLSTLYNGLINKYNRYAVQQGQKQLSQITLFQTKFRIPCKVVRIMSNSYGKFPDIMLQSGQMGFMEYGQFLNILSNYLPEAHKNNEDFKQFLRDQSKVTLEEYADVLLLSLPTPRVSYYESTNYEETQRKISVYAAGLVKDLGYYPVNISLDILNVLKNYSYAVLFMGLIFDIIILLFVVISVLLIYSLLMISVETKTFEIGVMRMVGLSKYGIVIMILLQGLMFVLPAIITGFAFSFPVLGIIYDRLLTKDLGIPNDPIPSTASVIQALAIGFIIPMLASIYPIKSSLEKELNDSLDYQRSKQQAIYVEVLKKEDQQSVTYQVIFGMIAVVYGLSIFYYLPISILELDFKMILSIFFFILVGMLLGLTLLAFNLQRVLEIILVNVMLIYEKKSFRQMVLKNLLAHKIRNKMTSLIFSLALGFIIFLIVSYNLQLQSVQLLALQKEGGYLIIDTADKGQQIDPKVYDEVIKRHLQNIQDFTYITADTSRKNTLGIQSIKTSDRARIEQFNTGVYGVQPSIFDAMINDFVKIGSQNDSTGMPLAEQLYTARGSQGMAVGTVMAKQARADNPEKTLYNHMVLSLELESKKIYYTMRNIFNTDRAPGFTMQSRKQNSQKNSALVSLPMHARISGLQSLRQVQYERLVVMFKDPLNKEQTDAFLQDLKNSEMRNENPRVFNANDQQETFEQVNLILNMIFNVIIAITMFLCFFSLSSSMTANLYEQSKEIGVMRAIGMNKTRIQLLYIYEAFILVMASSLMGILIGTMVGFTMVVQQMLFTDIPLIFFFPWTQFLIILSLSIICAFASTYGPTKNLTNKEISSVFRMT